MQSLKSSSWQNSSRRAVFKLQLLPLALETAPSSVLNGALATHSALVALQGHGQETSVHLEVQTFFLLLSQTPLAGDTAIPLCTGVLSSTGTPQPLLPLSQHIW